MISRRLNGHQDGGKTLDHQIAAEYHDRMQPSERFRTRLPLLLSLFLAIYPTVEVHAGRKPDQKELRKFGGLYVGTWGVGGGNLPIKFSMPRKGKGAAVGTFEATPLDSGDAQAPLSISIHRIKLSRNGKLLTSTGVATWERSRIPQWGGPNQSGPFSVKTKMVGRTPRAIGSMQFGSKGGPLTVGVGGISPTVSTPWMEFVFVGNYNNPNDPSDGAQITAGVQNFGSVVNDFSLGKHEVTNAQYIEFLNAAAKTDTYGLFLPTMGSDDRAGIVRSGSSGSFVYTLKRAELAAKPVMYVSFWDGCRFCNWLHNGKPLGLQSADTTENGAYDLTVPDAITNNTVARKSQAKFFIPSEDEWYKAAFHQPDFVGGDVDHYWLFPTKSNSAPTIATANSSGDINNSTSNIANYAQGAVWFTVGGNVTTVGTGGDGSASFYNAFDMAGNVWEWTEGTSSDPSARGIRGASWFTAESHLRSDGVNYWSAVTELNTIGFRISASVE